MKQFLLSIPFVIFVTLIPSFAYSANGNVTQLIFTTDEQILAPGVISTKINASTGEVFGETSDLYLTTTSATGEFSSSDTSWEAVGKLTWNSTYANRGFYYKDPTTGGYTITARLLGRTSGVTFSATQKITIGSGGSSGNATSTSSAATPANSGGGVATEAPARPQVLAGIRLHVPKLVSLHSPNYYWAETEHFEAVPDMFWNFGDGTSNSGTGAWHTYEHTGRYIISVRAPSAGAQAVARSVVEVTLPRVSIVSAETGLKGFVELENPNSTDVDVTGHELVSGRRNFRIPEGTFIAAGGSTFISNRVSGLDIADGLVYLNAQDGTRLESFSLVPTQAPVVGEGTVLGTSSVDVATVQKSLTQMRDILINMRALSYTPSAQPSALNLVVASISPNVSLAQSTTSLVMVIPRKISLFSRLLSLFK